MSRAMLCEPYDFSVLGSTAAESGTSSANLTNDEPGLVYRSNTAGGAFIEVDLGSAKAVGALAFLGCPNYAGTNRWRGATSQALLTTTPGYDSGTSLQIGFSTNRTASLTKCLHVPAAAQTFRYWRVDFLATGQKLEGWRLLVCSAMQPEENIQIGAEFSVDDRSIRRYARSGRRIVEPTVIVPAFQGEWPWITKTEYETQWRPFMLRGGATKPALFVLDPADNVWGEDAILYGDLEKSSRLVYNDGNVFGYNLAIVSIAP